MFSNFIRQFMSLPTDSPVTLQIGAKSVPLLVVRNPRARRYLLRLRPDGTARVTIPRGGNSSEARSFVERNRGWLEQQLARLASQPRATSSWRLGSEILFRGERVRIEADEPGSVRVGAEQVKVGRSAAPRPVPPLPDPSVPSEATADLRPPIERHLRSLAAAEFPARVAELAARHGFTVRRVTVRDQKSRWGSCSRRGTISLNWRLIQAPVSVLDYLILHELAHLRHMNHSELYWREVERLCPEFRAAEQWLKTHRLALR